MRPNELQDAGIDERGQPRARVQGGLRGFRWAAALLRALAFQTRSPAGTNNPPKGACTPRGGIEIVERLFLRGGPEDAFSSLPQTKSRKRDKRWLCCGYCPAMMHTHSVGRDVRFFPAREVSARRAEEAIRPFDSFTIRVAGIVAALSRHGSNAATGWRSLSRTNPSISRADLCLRLAWGDRGSVNARL